MYLTYVYPSGYKISYSPIKAYLVDIWRGQNSVKQHKLVPCSNHCIALRYLLNEQSNFDRSMCCPF